MILFADTETTGLPMKGQPAGSGAHPHIVQLGAQLCDSNRRVVAEMNLLIKPKNWGVPAEAAAVHGITTEMCAEYGFNIGTAMKLFAQLVRRSKLVVCHNLPFDDLLLQTEFIRCIYGEELEDYKAVAKYCTQEASAPILNLPPTPRMIAAGFNKPKSPNLREAYLFFTGKELEGAHDAMADVRGCRAVYYGIQDRAKEQEPLEV